MTTDSDKGIEVRSIDVLVGNKVPYTEMNETEIKNVIEWKADVKAAEKTYTAMLAAQDEVTSELVKKLNETALHALHMLETMVSNTMNRKLPETIDPYADIKEASKKDAE